VRIVIAVGGNALLERGEKPDATVQRRHVRRAARSLAPLTADHQLIVCHGNGPQIGLLAGESQSDPKLSRPYPLDVLGAQTQGMIGYWLAQSLRNEGVAKPVVAVVTQVVVDPSDPGFETPTKFVGSGYTQQDAGRLADLRGWTIARDGRRWRRVVASPEPVRVVELDTITGLLESQAVVICGGGGGAPVIDDGPDGLHGVEAVVDKDLTAAMLAINLGADRLILLTDVAAVMRNFGTAQAEPIDRLGLDEMDGMSFAAGSMGPKIEACRRFVQATRQPAAIGALPDARSILDGTAGTTVVADHSPQPVGAHDAVVINR